MEYRIRGVESPNGKKEIAFTKSLGYKKEKRAEDKKNQTGRKKKNIDNAHKVRVDNFGFSLHCLRIALFQLREISLLFLSTVVVINLYIIVLLVALYLPFDILL